MASQVHPKVKAAASAGSVGALVAWIVGLYGVTIPPEVAAAMTTLVSFVAGWSVPSAPEAPQPHPDAPGSAPQ